MKVFVGVNPPLPFNFGVASGCDCVRLGGRKGSEAPLAGEVDLLEPLFLDDEAPVTYDGSGMGVLEVNSFFIWERNEGLVEDVVLGEPR